LGLLRATFTALVLTFTTLTVALRGAALAGRGAFTCAARVGLAVPADPGRPLAADFAGAAAGMTEAGLAAATLAGGTLAGTTLVGTTLVVGTTLADGLTLAGRAAPGLAWADVVPSGRAGGRTRGPLVGGVADRAPAGAALTACGDSLAFALRGTARTFFTGGGAGGGRRPSRKRMLLSMEAVSASLTIVASAFSFVFRAS